MKVRMWVNDSGSSPVERFINEQPAKHGARIMKDIGFLEKVGLELLGNPSRLKQLKGYKNLFELKVSIQGVYYRILFTVIRGEAWLVEAFKKKDNATKKRYIEKALGRIEMIEA